MHVYFIFFSDFTIAHSKIEIKKKNKRPNKENRVLNSEYMHTGDKSFGLEQLCSLVSFGFVCTCGLHLFFCLNRIFKYKLLLF